MDKIYLFNWLWILKWGRFLSESVETDTYKAMGSSYPVCIEGLHVSGHSLLCWPVAAAAFLWCVLDESLLRIFFAESFDTVKQQ